MLRTACLLLALLPIAASAEGDSPVCKSVSASYDTLRISCVVPPADKLRRFDFQVKFSGGHDDTSARLSLGPGAAQQACESGSKPQLEGEFGDIELRCLVSVGASRNTGRIDFSVQWRHAELTGYGLLAR